MTQANMDAVFLIVLAAIVAAGLIATVVSVVRKRREQRRRAAVPRAGARLIPSVVRYTPRHAPVPVAPAAWPTSAATSWQPEPARRAYPEPDSDSGLSSLIGVALSSPSYESPSHSYSSDSSPSSSDSSSSSSDSFSGGGGESSGGGSERD